MLLEIKLHNKFNVGINENFYNKAKQTSTGFGYTGFLVSEETKVKISKALKGKKKTPFSKEHKENIRKTRIGKELSEETKNKLSKALMGIKRPLRSNEIKKKYAKKIGIYNRKDELKFISEYNFEKFCKDNDLPFKQLKNSHQKEGLRLYENLSTASKSAINRYKQLLYYYKYIGWYAKIIQK